MPAGHHTLSYTAYAFFSIHRLRITGSASCSTTGDTLGATIDYFHGSRTLDGLTGTLLTRPTRDSPVLHPRDDCEPENPLNTLTDRLNTLLNSSGPGYILPLCPSTQYYIQAPILFFAPGQEISTVGYPSGDERATLVVDGPVALGQGHTTAVDGTCQNCSGVKLRNIQASIHLLWGSPSSHNDV